MDTRSLGENCRRSCDQLGASPRAGREEHSPRLLRWFTRARRFYSRCHGAAFKALQLFEPRFVEAVFGAIYHDIGKISELGFFDNGIHYTDRGRLVGHMGIACEMIDEKARALDGFPVELRDILKHITVLSHHGRLEYGSPKLPMLAEAVVVAMIDDLDSKMNTISQFLTSEVNQLPGDRKVEPVSSGI